MALSTSDCAINVIFAGEIMPFKDRMKEIRNDSGFSQKQMSESLGVSLRTLQRYEEGSKVPDVMSLVNLAISGYNIHWLVTGDGNKYHWKKPFEDRYLQEISIWLEEEAEKEVKIRDWFKIQFEIAFPTFKEWRESKKISTEPPDSTTLKCR